MSESAVLSIFEVLFNIRLIYSSTYGKISDKDLKTIIPKLEDKPKRPVHRDD